jgi:prevent-host-death family protein
MTGWKEAGCLMKQVPLNEVKDDLSNFLRLAEKEDIVITRHGKPAGYIVGFADEDDWIDYMMLRDPKFRERLQQSLQDMREGRVVTLEEVRAQNAGINGKTKAAGTRTKKRVASNGHKKRAAKVLQPA